MDKNEGEILSGNISLRIYGMDGIDEEYNELSHIATISNSEKANPFFYLLIIIVLLKKRIYPQNLVKMEWNWMTVQKEIQLKKNITGKYQRILKMAAFLFLPSNQYVEGSTYKSLYSKSNKYSIRFEYNILALEDENRAYMDLSNRNITIKYLLLL